MKKYKHKKTGDIVLLSDNTNGAHISFLGDQIIPRRYIENSNDWEEIVEKDYQILSYYDKANECYYKPDSQLKGKWCKRDGEAPFFTEDKLTDYCNIHSIKRLSDGEVFTIGDTVDGFFDKECIISSIKFDCVDKLRLFYDKDCRNMNLSDAKHTKQPLFTTEDGVEIFEENIPLFIVAKDSYYLADVESSKSYRNAEKWYWFSTKEKAQEYIDYNKPKYSLKDIESRLNTIYCNYNNRDEIDIRRGAKMLFNCIKKL